MEACNWWSAQKSHIKFLQKKNCKARKQALLWKKLKGELRAVILKRKCLQVKDKLKKICIRFKPLSYQKTDTAQTELLREKIEIMKSSLLPGHIKWFNFLKSGTLINLCSWDFRM